MKPRYLSPSALEAWDWCPLHRYAKSYKERVAMSPITPVWFGTAVHSGIESFYRQGDWEMAFVVAWRKSLLELEAADKVSVGVQPEDRSGLLLRGLELIQSVLALRIEGEPEWPFEVKLAGLDVPVKGRVDLIDRRGHKLYDWKSSNRGWSAAMAERKVWQPALYSLAYEATYSVVPSFQYVILPVLGYAPAYLLPAPRTAESRVAAVVRAQEILTLIRAEEWGPCTCPPAYRPKEVAA